MINAILQATRLGAGAVSVDEQVVNMTELLDDIRSHYEFPLGKDVKLEWEYASVPSLQTDGDKIKQFCRILSTTLSSLPRKARSELLCSTTPTLV